MTRPLKFRAWDEGLKCYFYDAAIYPNNIVAIQRHNIESMMLNAQYGATHWTELGESAIVEQYTGLKDKNGKEIYEGDIAKYGDNMAVIIWREENAEFGVRWLDCGVEDSVSWQIGVEKTPSEIIGNIHENPELMEGEE